MAPVATGVLVRITCAAFLCHFFTLGFAFTVGIYYATFRDVFLLSGNTLVAFTTSLNFAVLCASGPLAGVLIHYAGCRCCMLAGSLIGSVGLGVSAFCVRIGWMVFSFGFVTGFGFGLCFMSGIGIVGLQDHRMRPLAFGVSMAGGGVGAALYPTITNTLISQFGWRGSLLLAAGLHLQICVCSSLLYEDHRLLAVPSKRSASTVRAVGSQWKSLWTWRFVLLAVNCFLFCFGLSVVMTHVVAYSIAVGLTTPQSAMMMSVNGVSITIGRCSLGALVSFRVIDNWIIFAVAYLISGISIFAVGLVRGPYVLTGVVGVSGFFMSAFGPCLSEATLNVVGHKKFVLGYGTLNFVMGVGTSLGASAAAAVYQLTTKYNTSFYVGSVAVILSALCILPVIVVNCASTDGNELRLHKSKIPKIASQWSHPTAVS